jgi:hypothetical protein
MVAYKVSRVMMSGTYEEDHDPANDEDTGANPVGTSVMVQLV